MITSRVSSVTVTFGPILTRLQACTIGAIHSKTYLILICKACFAQTECEACFAQRECEACFAQTECEACFAQTECKACFAQTECEACFAQTECEACQPCSTSPKRALIDRNNGLFNRNDRPPSLIFEKIRQKYAICGPF